MSHRYAILAAVLVVGCTSKDAKSTDTNVAPPIADLNTLPPPAQPEVPPAPPAAATVPVAMRMVTVSMEKGTVKTVEPLQFVDYAFEVPKGSCTVKGRIEGLAGGNKDFEAFILDDDNFKIWESGLEPKGAASGRGVKWEFTEKVSGPGRFHLVVNNRFSDFAKKVVKVWASRTCPSGSVS